MMSRKEIVEALRAEVEALNRAIAILLATSPIRGRPRKLAVAKPVAKQPKGAKQPKALPKARAKREWTPEQRAAQAERMRQAIHKKGGSLSAAAG